MTAVVAGWANAVVVVIVVVVVVVVCARARSAQGSTTRDLTPPRGADLSEKEEGSKRSRTHVRRVVTHKNEIAPLQGQARALQRKRRRW